METIYLGAGCFWCTEAVIQSIRGVISVLPGYMGGHTDNPTYEQVCGGKTGHIEVAKVEYDPSLVSTEDILNVFFNSHDPTSLDKQGADIGPQYRSAIFYTNKEQKDIATKMIFERNNLLDERKIVTEIKEAATFFPAENYHHNYYEQNKDKAYCQVVIKPKMEKLEKNYNHLLNKK